MSEPWFVQGSSVPSQKAVFPSSSGNWGGLETRFWTRRNKQKLVGNVWGILLFPHRLYAFYLVNSFLFLPLECGCEAGGRAAVLQPWGQCRKKILLSLRSHCTALVCLPLVLSLCEKKQKTALWLSLSLLHAAKHNLMFRFLVKQKKLERLEEEEL